MRQFYFLIFILLGFTAKSQIAAMCDDSSRWAIQTSYGDHSEFQSYSHTSLEFFKGDTLINDSIFHKYYTRTLSAHASGPRAMYDTTFSDNEASLFALGFEDLNKGLYYRALDGSEFYMVWDYQLQAGDTFYQDSDAGRYDDVLIDSTGTMEDSTGVIRKVWYCSGLYNGINGDWPARFVAGIGALEYNGGGPLNGFDYVALGPTYDNNMLNCFAYNRVSAWGNCSEQVLSLPDSHRLLGSLKLFPNPLSDQLNLEIPHKGELRIVDSSGKVFYQTKQQKGNAVLNTAEWPNGLYQLLFVADNGTLFSGKVLKGE